MFKIKTITAAVALMGAFAAPAMASTINVGLQDPYGNVFEDSNGANDWKIITRFSVDGSQKSAVYAGVFRLTSDATGSLSDFLAFCLQPLETLTLPKDHHIGSAYGETITQNLNILAANAWDSVVDSKTAAAFQMAAWEITTETNDMFDIDAGTFAITYNTTASNDAEGVAQGWLDNISNNTWSDNGAEFVILNAGGTQDLLTDVNAVPLPASGLLLLGGLFGAGAFARRRKARTA